MQILNSKQFTMTFVLGEYNAVTFHLRQAHSTVDSDTIIIAQVRKTQERLNIIERKNKQTQRSFQKHGGEKRMITEQ